MERISERALGLMEPLYGAAFGGQNDWAGFLEQLTLATEGNAGVLALIGTRVPSAEFIAQSGVPEEMQKQYAERFVAIDPWPAAFRESGLPLGRNGCSQDFVSTREFARSEYYNEFWKPNGDLFHTCGGFFAVDDAHVGLLATPRSRRRRPFGAHDAALLDLVAPHVGRALQLRQRLMLVEGVNHTFQAALDATGDALLVVDAAAKILFANRAAELELSRARCLRSRHGCLTSTTAQTDSELRAAIRSTALVSDKRSLACPAPVRLDTLGAPMIVSCFPLPVRQVDTAGFPSASRVLVVINDPRQPLQGLAQLLRLLYGLTPTEALIAEGLGHGMPLEGIADKLRMTKGTARIHLRHIFSKTQARRQAELVALIHRSTPTGILRGR